MTAVLLDTLRLHLPFRIRGGQFNLKRRGQTEGWARRQPDAYVHLVKQRLIITYFTRTAFERTRVTLWTLDWTAAYMCSG